VIYLCEREGQNVGPFKNREDANRFIEGMEAAVGTGQTLK
jgi:hypothetical protein